MDQLRRRAGSGGAHARAPLTTRLRVLPPFQRHPSAPLQIDARGFARAAELVLRGDMAGATANGVQQDGRYYDIYAFRSCNLRWNPKVLIRVSNTGAATSHLHADAP